MAKKKISKAEIELFRFVLFTTISISIMFAFASCEPSHPIREMSVEEIKSREKINIEKMYQVMKPDGQGGGTLRIITLDSFEYVMWYSDNGVAMCPKQKFKIQ